MSRLIVVLPRAQALGDRHYWPLPSPPRRKYSRHLVVIRKRYGAFRSTVDFDTNFLEISWNRCFYEIIRNDRPCKACLDLEADAGAMTEGEGQEMCNAVIRE